MSGIPGPDSPAGKRILVVSQLFHPEQFRVNDLCLELSRRGYRITVLTGIPNYPEGRFFRGYGYFSKRREVLNGIRILRLPITPRRSGSAALALNYLSFVIAGGLWAAFTRHRADLVFVYEGSPMTQALPGVWFAKRRGIPCHIYVMDPWPEILTVVPGIRSPRLLCLIGRLSAYIYRRCRAILIPSRAFRGLVESRGAASEKIIYWPQYAEDFYRPLPKTRHPALSGDGFFNIAYTGNIGFAQGLMVLIRAAEILRDRELSIRIHLIGGGRNRDRLIREVSEKGLSGLIRFMDRVPAEEIPRIIAACDASLLCLDRNEVLSRYVPAKLQSYMACGSPILASADGETARIIAEAGCGLCSPAGDAPRLADIMAELSGASYEERKRLSQNALCYAQRVFGREPLMEQLVGVFEGRPVSEGADTR